MDSIGEVPGGPVRAWFVDNDKWMDITAQGTTYTLLMGRPDDYEPLNGMTIDESMRVQHLQQLRDTSKNRPYLQIFNVDATPVLCADGTPMKAYASSAENPRWLQRTPEGKTEERFTSPPRSAKPSSGATTPSSGSTTASGSTPGSGAGKTASGAGETASIAPVGLAGYQPDHGFVRWASNKKRNVY